MQLSVSLIALLLGKHNIPQIIFENGAHLNSPRKSLSVSPRAKDSTEVLAPGLLATLLCHQRRSLYYAYL